MKTFGMANNVSMDTSSEESDADIFELNESALRPYDFEPMLLNSSAQEQINGSEHSNTPSQARRGNTVWCACGKCRSMDTDEESKFCREAGEVHGNYFEGKKCITDNDNFRAVCLQREVLKTVLHMLTKMRGDDINIQNKSLRYAGYRHHAWWVHNRLGRGIRRVIPSCTIRDIRDAFPELGEVSYVPFQEAMDEMNA